MFISEKFVRKFCQNIYLFRFQNKVSRIQNFNSSLFNLFKHYRSTFFFLDQSIIKRNMQNNSLQFLRNCHIISRPVITIVRTIGFQAKRVKNDGHPISRQNVLSDVCCESFADCSGNHAVHFERLTFVKQVVKNVRIKFEKLIEKNLFSS